MGVHVHQQCLVFQDWTKQIALGKNKMLISSIRTKELKPFHSILVHQQEFKTLSLSIPREINISILSPTVTIIQMLFLEMLLAIQQGQGTP